MKLNQLLIIKTLIFLNTSITQFVKQIFCNAVKRISISSGYALSLHTSSKYIYPFLYFSKFHSLCLFRSLIDIACVDHLGSVPRFMLNYNLLSLKFGIRLLIKTNISSLSLLLTAGSIFNSAKWSEREVYEFYGVGFWLHKDLRKLLLDYGFKGYPLLKDFPVSGFVEVLYNENLKKINYRDLELVQEYRSACLKRFLI